MGGSCLPSGGSRLVGGIHRDSGVLRCGNTQTQATMNAVESLGLYTPVCALNAAVRFV